MENPLAEENTSPEQFKQIIQALTEQNNLLAQQLKIVTEDQNKMKKKLEKKQKEKQKSFIIRIRIKFTLSIFIKK